MSSYFQLLFVLFLAFVISQVRSQDDRIVFKESVDNISKITRPNRKPVVHLPLCAENELPYPIDQSVGRTCDCKPGFLYVPTSNKCFPAYERGPCRAREYLILPPNTSVPVCQRSPCSLPKFVRINKICVELGSPCGEDSSGRIGVDEVSFLIVCHQVPLEHIQNSLKKRSAENNEEEKEQAKQKAIANSKNCPKGCRRYLNKQCPGQENYKGP